MTSQINTRQIGLLFVVGLGLIFAMFAGNYIAEEDYLPIVVVLGFLIVLTVILGVSKSIYLLIPVCWGLTGSVSALPLPFSVRQLVIIAAGAIFISSIIFKRQSAKVT